MLDGPAVFYNASLEGSSSWANMFLGRDHHQATQPAEPDAKKDDKPK